MLLEGIIGFGFVILSFLAFGALALAAIMILVAILRSLLGKKRKQTPDRILAEGLKDLIRSGKADEALLAYQKFTGQDEQRSRIELQKMADALDTECQQIN